MMKTAASLLAPVALLASPVSGQGLAIEHQGVGCLVAERHPELQACVSNPAAVARIRVNFRADAHPHWYYVEMSPQAGRCYAGALPQPSRTTRQVHYYITVVGHSFSESRTAEFSPAVERSCDRKLAVATTLPSASVIVGAAAGAPTMPAGFASAGVVSTAATTTAAAGTGATAGAAGGSGAGAASTTAGSGAAGGGGGGGAGKALLILGGLGAAGAGAYFALKNEEECPGLEGIPIVRLTVGAGTTPTFSWDPPCPAHSIFVESATNLADFWILASPGSERAILPPIGYGEPRGQVVFGPRSLTPGARYRVTIAAGPEPNRLFDMATAEFTP